MALSPFGLRLGFLSGRPGMGEGLGDLSRDDFPFLLLFWLDLVFFEPISSSGEYEPSESSPVVLTITLS